MLHCLHLQKRGCISLLVQPPATPKGAIRQRMLLQHHVHFKLLVQDCVAKPHQVVCNGAPAHLCSPYPEVFGIPDAYHLFFLHHGGLPEARRERAIATVKAHHARQKLNFLGYQANFAAADYQQQLGSYLDTLVNNMGDAFVESNITMNSKFMERAVLDYYVALWHVKWPHSDTDPESYWGFALTMGCTEGNLYSMWNAREYLSGKKILMNSHRHRGDAPAIEPHGASPESNNSPKAYSPIAFFSEDTHCSFAKAMNMLGICTFSAEGRETYPGQCPITDDGHWPAQVPSHDTGAMNIDRLAALVEFFASHGHPIVVSFNYGTTFRGAYDDVALACEKLKPILQKCHLFEREVHYIDENGSTGVDVRTGYWFHVDGALGAAYIPFVEMAYHRGLVDKTGPVFDFRLPMVHSIAMSGHKWIGAPMPCGIYMTKTKYRMLPLDPKHSDSPDTTFSGSRNGLSPMLLWNYIARHSHEDQMRRVLRLEDLAVYAERRLRHLQDEVLKTDLYVERAPLALSVCFKRANDELCKKYSLANEKLGGRTYSHVFLMNHVTHELVDAFIEDLSKDGAFAT